MISAQCFPAQMGKLRGASLSPKRSRHPQSAVQYVKKATPKRGPPGAAYAPAHQNSLRRHYARLMRTTTPCVVITLASCAPQLLASSLRARTMGRRYCPFYDTPALVLQPHLSRLDPQRVSIFRDSHFPRNDKLNDTLFISAVVVLGAKD